MRDAPFAYLSQPDELLLDLYASAAQPSRWTDSLDRLCASMGACSAVVQAFRFEGEHANVLWVARDSRTLAGLAREPRGLADRDNPRLNYQRALRGLGRVAGDEQLFDPGDEARPQLAQRLATLGLGRFIGTLQEVGRGVYLGLALHRAVGDAQDFAPHHAQRLADLAPHLGQAFLLTEQLSTSVQRDERLRALMDSLRFGIVLCDESGAVQWCNKHALDLLGAEAALMLRGESLHGRSTADTHKLLGLLRGDSGAHNTNGTAGSPVGYLRLGEGTGSLHVAVQACGEAGGRILVISAAEQTLDLPAGALENLFGLTPTEARLLGALATGSSVEDYALQRGVSVGTARVQLKQIQAKTGQHRQADLVRLVLSSAATHLAGSGNRIWRG